LEGFFVGFFLSVVAYAVRLLVRTLLQKALAQVVKKAEKDKVSDYAVRQSISVAANAAAYPFLTLQRWLMINPTFQFKMLLGYVYMVKGWRSLFGGVVSYLVKDALLQALTMLKVRGKGALRM